MNPESFGYAKREYCVGGGYDIYYDDQYYNRCTLVMHSEAVTYYRHIRTNKLGLKEWVQIKSHSNPEKRIGKCSKITPLALAARLKAANINFVCLIAKGHTVGDAKRLAATLGHAARPQHFIIYYEGVYYIMEQRPAWLNSALGRI